MFNVYKIREDFPALSRKVYGKPLIYMDNGATTQKPIRVIEKLNEVYTQCNSNVHRGVHHLSIQMTEAYEEARSVVRQFINAQSNSEIIFTSGTTGSVNLVASSFGDAFIRKDDQILITGLEHHSNIVPWQMLAERKNAHLKVLPIHRDGTLMVESLDSYLNEKTRLFALSHVSNALGTINPVKELVEAAHKYNIPVLVDGAQAIQHEDVDVMDLNCDFYAFSGHKAYGPNGIGVLYGKEEWLEKLPPYQFGGDMVATVSFKKTTFAGLPLKFEAGTANYPSAIGMAEAFRYLNEIGKNEIAGYERELLDYGNKTLEKIEGLSIFGASKKKISMFSFLLDGIHPSDTGSILDKMGIAVRTGHHCAQPIMDFYGIEGTVRASLAFYNTKDEIDRLAEGIKKVKKMFG